MKVSSLDVWLSNHCLTILWWLIKVWLALFIDTSNLKILACLCCKLEQGSSSIDWTKDIDGKAMFGGNKTSLQ